MNQTPPKKSHRHTTFWGILGAVGNILTLCPFPYAPLVGAGISAVAKVGGGLAAADAKTVNENSIPR